MPLTIELTAEIYFFFHHLFHFKWRFCQVLETQNPIGLRHLIFAWKGPNSQILQNFRHFFQFAAL